MDLRSRSTMSLLSNLSKAMEVGSPNSFAWRNITMRTAYPSDATKTRASSSRLRNEWGNINVAGFIAAVRDRPPIWDNCYRMPGNFNLAERLWKEVFREVYQPYDTLDEFNRSFFEFYMKQKWEDLRQEFIEEKKRISESDDPYNTAPEFKYYKLMKFILPTLTHKEMVYCMSGLAKHDKTPGPAIYENNTNIGVLAHRYFDCLVTADLKMVPPEETELVRDIDRYVMLTFVPFLNKIPDDKKDAVYIDIHQTIENYLIRKLKESEDFDDTDPEYDAEEEGPPLACQVGKKGMQKKRRRTRRKRKPAGKEKKE